MLYVVQGTALLEPAFESYAVNSNYTSSNTSETNTTTTHLHVLQSDASEADVLLLTSLCRAVKSVRGKRSIQFAVAYNHRRTPRFIVKLCEVLREK